jgi:hypothetical protein
MRAAFTFTDDTDFATTEKVRIIYNRLEEAGLRVTKTVWAFPATRTSGTIPEGMAHTGSSTLADPEYCQLIKTLILKGHEISLHGASAGNNTRNETIAAYKLFNKMFGFYPKLHINHGRNIDNLYWNRDIIPRGILQFLAKLYVADKSEGHKSDSPYYWGDICQNRIRYVRGFKSLCLNTRRFNPSMPFFDPDKPLVPRWFSCTDLADSWLVKRTITKPNLDRLICQYGVCIGYTYLSRFVGDNGVIDGDMENALSLLSSCRNSIWFAGTSDILDRLEFMRNISIIRSRGYYHITNNNAVKVDDLWIHGKSGEQVILENGSISTIGSSGYACVSLPKPGKSSLCSAVLKKTEFARMLAGQIILLLTRHLHGRHYTRKGWS